MDLFDGWRVVLFRALKVLRSFLTVALDDRVRSVRWRQQGWRAPESSTEMTRVHSFFQVLNIPKINFQNKALPVNVWLCFHHTFSAFHPVRRKIKKKKKKRRTHCTSRLPTGEPTSKASKPRSTLLSRKHPTTQLLISKARTWKKNKNCESGNGLCVRLVAAARATLYTVHRPTVKKAKLPLNPTSNKH